MDGSYDEIMIEFEEGSSILRSGIRFWKEKRKSTRETPIAPKKYQPRETMYPHLCALRRCHVPMPFTGEEDATTMALTI